MPTGYIAVDLGAESGRIIVGLLEDDKLHLEEIHRFLHQPVVLPSDLHWDVTVLWREICVGLTKTAQWSAEHGVRLVSVGVDTWGVDWALVGKSGELVGLPHAYRDPRNQAAYQRALDKLGADKIYQATGAQLSPFDSLFSLHAQSQLGPETLDAAESLLFMPDLFHYWLSGVKINEVTVASTSQMIDARTRDRVPELLGALDIPDRLCGTITSPGSRIGVLRKEIADETDLPADLQVVAPASHDTASAVAAVPVEGDDDWCFFFSGTWSLFGAELTAPCITPETQANGFANELGLGNRVRFLKVLPGLWLVQERRRDFARKGQEFDYEQLTQSAREAAPFRTQIDPSHADFQSSGQTLCKIERHASETGQPIPALPGEFIRCCLESLALSCKQTLPSLSRRSNVNLLGSTWWGAVPKTNY